MVLRAGYLQLALRMQEAASDLSARDIQTRLSDAINDLYRGTGTWAYYIDHIGDGESGDVIYSHDSDTCKAPYSCTDAGGAVKCVIDVEAKVSVCPRTIYEVEADEEDHYAAMEEAFKAEGLYTSLPLYERFISKKERDQHSAEDFAGKGKSYPIFEPGDIEAAVRSIGRAGAKNLGPSGLKARIIAIAKRKGWTKYLPKSWQEEKTSEAAASSPQVSRETSLTLVESATTLETIVLQEARSDYEIKLIAPGKGSSAFYPAEVLKRDGPKVFTAGTHVYLNHATQAEEAARPEGDVRNLAGVLTTAAAYSESHAKGPGLYARMKVFADHAQVVEEKAPHVGMSIRAGGVAESGKMKEGLPILKEFTSAESVDVVTRAGAGGMILTEAARAATEETADMEAAEVQRLIEAATNPLRERALKGDATVEATRLLATVTLPEASKQRVIEAVLGEPLPLTEAKALDLVNFRESVNARAKTEGEYVATLTGAGRVLGMGAGAVPDTDPVRTREARQAEEADAKRDLELAESVFGRLMGNKEAGIAAARKGVAA